LAEEVSEAVRPVSHRGRVAPRVALALLESIRDLDLPEEVLQDEDLSLTLPRRLGLSDVVEAQIRRYRVGGRRRVTDAELRDLARLVVRRPDSEAVFLRAGGMLARSAPPSPRHRPGLFLRWSLVMARRRTRATLRSLFGRPIVRLLPGAFSLQAVDDTLLEWDPGGDACALVSGLAEAILPAGPAGRLRVVHTSCRARGDTGCVWVMEEAVPPLP